MMTIISTDGKSTVMAATTVGQLVDKEASGYVLPMGIILFCSQCAMTRLGCTCVVVKYEI